MYVSQISMYVGIYVSEILCMYVCMLAGMRLHVSGFVCRYVCLSVGNVCLYLGWYVYMYVGIYV